MAKAPSMGKSRLRAALSTTETTALSSAFLQDTWQLATCSAFDPVLCFAPATAESEFREVLPAAWLTRAQPFVQQGADLTTRVIHAFQHLFAMGYENVALLNSDTPDLPLAALQTAYAHLVTPGSNPGIVLGPTDDGGYYLVGLHRSASLRLAALFEGMEWSTPHVLDDTLARATAMNLQVQLGPPWTDVDTPPDLDALQARLRAAAPNIATRTRAVLVWTAPQ
ncbi:MAG: TIGR04282 family arsenosugar biosynthesis glycosyltransferase [Terriglobales bacterium]